MWHVVIIWTTVRLLLVEPFGGNFSESRVEQQKCNCKYHLKNGYLDPVSIVTQHKMDKEAEINIYWQEHTLRNYTGTGFYVQDSTITP